MSAHEVRRWGSGLAAALALHLLPIGLLLLWLHPSNPLVPPPPPPAVLIDMAPPAPDPAPSPSQPPPPAAPQPQVEPARPTAPKLPALAAAAVSLPPAQPAPPTDGAPAPRPGATTAVPAPPAPPAPARASAPAAANVSPTWQGLLLGRLERYKRYPPGARAGHQQGVAFLRFTMDRAGHVLSADIAKGSGIAALDDEAVALVRRAQPLPKPPPQVTGETIELVVPIEFTLDRRR